MSARRLFHGAVALAMVIALEGCEQLLDVDAYTERGTDSTSATGAGGTGGSGGAPATTSATTTASTTSATTSTGQTNECYNEADIVHLDDSHIIAGHQGRCTTQQISDIADCWLSSDWACGAVFGEPANADCKACVRGTPASMVIPAQLTAFGLNYYYTQVVACEAVVQDKLDCLEAVQLELCRLTACEACYDVQPDYYECQDYAVQHACSDILLPPGCETLITELSPECYAPTIAERAIETVTVLCGP